MDHQRFTRLAAMAVAVAALSPAPAALAAPAADPAPVVEDTTQTPSADGSQDSTDTGGAAETGNDAGIPDGATVTASYLGKTYRLTARDGVWTGDAKTDGADWRQNPRITWTRGSDHGVASVNGSGWKTQDSPTGTLGVTRTTGSNTFTGDGVRFTVSTEYTTGSELKAGWDQDRQDTKLTAGADGTFTARMPADGLHTNNAPYHDSVLVGGHRLAAVWTAPAATVTDKGLRIWRRSMTAEGDIAGAHVRITGDAIRVHDAHVGLTVTRTDADGRQSQISVPGSAVDDPADLKDEYTLEPQSWDAISDQYTIGGEQGPDASFDKPVYALGGGADRVITQRVTWTDANGLPQSKTVTVHIPFDMNMLAPDSPAKLEGIYVNMSGAHSKGQLIKGWNPNILSYAVQVGENDPSPYILPVGGDDVTVTAGDVVQTAYTATQTWEVRVKVGDATRSYRVTVIRAHTTPTADEAFTPGEARPETPTEPVSSPTDTSLESWGWRGTDGVYHVEQSDSFQIPEGGVIAWKAKDGQTVTNTVEKTAPMHYTHLLGVLASDGLTFATRTLDVTYITADTHRAELTGLTANGLPVAGFTPAGTEYTVTVDDPASWTLVPRYDKRLGMAIATHRDGAVSTVKVTSADGLVSRTYTVRAQSREQAAAAGSAGGRRELARTGIGASLMLLLGLPAMAAGAAGWVSSRRRTR